MQNRNSGTVFMYDDNEIYKNVLQKLNSTK